MDAIAQYNKIIISKKQGLTKSLQEKTNDFIEKLSTKATDVFEQAWELSDGKKTNFKIFNNTQLGSNRGFYALNTETQELFYAKFPNKIQNIESTQANTEVFASKVYELLGLNTPDMQLIKTSEGQIGTISKYIPDLKPIYKPTSNLSYALEIIKKAPDNVKINPAFMQEVKKTILSTPLDEFETYRLKNGIEINKPSFFKKIDFQILRKKSSLIQEMTKQRDELDKESLNELRVIKTVFENASRFIRTPFYSMVGSYNYARIKKLDSAIAQCKIPQKMTLYRGTNAEEFIFDDTIKLNEFLKAFYKKGDYFTIETYPCTSLSEKVSKSFIHGDNGLLFKINVPKGTHGVYMEGIHNAWNEVNEEEVLLARNLIYKFKNRTPYFTRDEIELDIVPFDKLPKNAKVHNYQEEVQKIKENGTFTQIFPTVKEHMV